MPLTLLIESELDERSATAAANRAERVYAEASRNISKSMTSQIGEGARETGKAVEKMADSARASYQKVLKAQDELAQQERQLKQMREDGARGVEVQAERVRQARRREKEAIREAASAMDDYERSATRVGESGARAGVMLRQGLREGVQNGLSDVTRQFGAMGTIADTAFAGISRSGGMAALGVAGVGLAAVAVAQQFYQLGKQWDAVGDSIAFRTGAVDGELQGITDSVKRVASDTAAPIEAIGDIGGQVVQSMKLSGPELDAMTQRLAILQEAGNPVGVRELAKAYNVFGIEAKDQAATLDRLFNVSQSTGIPMQELVTTLNQAGRATKQFGLDAGQTAGLLATFEQAGLNGDSVTKSLTIALKNFSKEGREAGPALAETVQRIQDLSDAHQDEAAAQLAATTFGKGYLDMLNAIKDHRLTADDLTAPFDAAGKSIPEAADQVEDFAEKWQKFKNNLSSGPLASAGSSVFDFLNGQMQQSLDLLKNFNNEWDKAFGGGGNNAAAGTPGVIFGGGGTFDGGPDRSGLTGARAGGFGGFSRPDPGWGYKDDPARSSSSTSSAPAVPYAPGYGRAPMPGESAAMYGAEQNVLEAQHRRETAEAVLAQVMADSTRTANDEVKAQNDVAQAKKAEIDANLRLQETSAKAANSLNKATDQMSEFGASIDADFGASKGLPGILENVVKFVGNLALAGPMAQMNAISAANPNQGSGLMGMLASSGAFGSQYTPQAIAAAGGQGGQAGYSGGAYGPSQMGPAALQPGGPVGSARAGESAREFAHRVMMPHWQSQGLTVGDHQADKYGEHQNGALDIMVPNIAKGNSVLQQVLSDPNVYGAIFNNQAYGYGQGASPRPYSGGFTGNPTQDHQDHVHAWYKPGGENNITPAGPSAGGGWQGPGLNPGMYSGGGGQSPVFGGPGGPGVGGAVGQSDPFGVAPTTGPGGGGVGITPGGTIDTAIGIAAAGANLIAPGAGAAAQAGMKLASRAIQFGGQAAGIGLDGLMQTFLPAGSQKAGSGWLQRGVGALASVKPALPNLAGGKGSPQVGPGMGAQGQQQGQTTQGGNTYNTTVNSNADTISGAAKDAEFHFSAQNSGPGN